METAQDNRAILVTGSSTGIGRATALLLDKNGFRVFASVRRQEDGDRLRAAASERLTPVLMDVTDETSIARARDEVAGKLGGKGLWGLVNNAGTSFRAPLECAPLDEFRRLYESNVFGLLAVTQAFLPMIRRARGRIVNVSSLTTLMVTPYHGIYSSSKMAVNGITDALRLEMKPLGVEVSLMICGGVNTELWDRVARLTREISGKFRPEHVELYAAGLKKAVEYFSSRARSGLSPEQAAQPIVHALTADRPKRTYYVGPDAKLMNLLDKIFRGRLHDWFILKNMGLDK